MLVSLIYIDLTKKKKAELFEQGLSIEGFRFIDQ